MSYLDGLNPAQKEAVLHSNGPLLIVAGAGAGKTKTITHRIAHLVATGTPSDAILAVTFTNKAAGEMRERVEKMMHTLPTGNAPLSMSADRRLPLVATFHSLCVRLLREHAHALNLPRSFTIWDRSDSSRAVKRALEQMGMEREFEPKTILGRISREKGEALTQTEFSSKVRNPYERTVSEAWRYYEEEMARDHALDFDDLLLKTLVLFRENPAILERIRSRYTHLTVDEYQDTNRVQFEIARLIATPRNNICVVGDIDQNIYSWRGADIEHLLSFERTFPGSKVVLLEQNYRSTQTILSAAQDVIGKNKRRIEKKLFTENGEGENLSVYYAMNESDEAYFVASRAAELISAGTRPQEIAVLYRANFQSRTLEEAFLNVGTPYRVLGTKFFDRKEVKDILSYIRASTNPESRVDIARIIGTPARGIGKATLTKILEGKRDELSGAAQGKTTEFFRILSDIQATIETKKVSEVVKYTITRSGLEASLKGGGEEGQERLENLRELVSLATKYDEEPGPDQPRGIEKLIEERG